MRNKGTWILFLVVVLLSSYAYFGEYKGKEKEKTFKEEQAKVFKDIKMEQVNNIVLEKGTNKISLTRSTDGWALVEPVKDAADSEGVDSWLKQLTEEKTFATAVEANDIKWQFFGFDKNVAKITLSTTAGNTAVVEISEKVNFENNSFIRYPGQNKVFVAGASWGGHATKKAFDLRNKRIFRHQISNVQSLNIKNKKEKFNFENKEAKWISATNPEWVLDQNKVRETIAKLNEAQAQEILVESADLEKQKTKYNFTNPEISIEVNLNDKKWTAAVIQLKDKSYAMLINEPALIVKLDNSFAEKFGTITLESYRDTKLPFISLDKAKVKNIDYETSLKKASLVEKNGNWDLAKEDTAIEVQQEKVKNLLDKIKDLNVLNYSSEQELKKAKLTQKIQFLDQEKKSVFELTMSETIKKKIDNVNKNIRLAKTNLYKDPFFIEETEVEKLQLNELTKIKVTENKEPAKATLPSLDVNSLPSKEQK